MADFIDSSLFYPSAPNDKYVYGKKIPTKQAKLDESINVKVPKPSVNHSFPSFSVNTGKKYTSKTYRSLSFQDDNQTLDMLGSLVSINESDDPNKQTKPFYKKRIKSKSKTLKILKFDIIINLLTSIRDKLKPKGGDEENLIFGMEEKPRRVPRTRKKKRQKNKEKSKSRTRRKKVKKVTWKSCKIVSKCLFSMTTAPNIYLSGPMHVCANYDQENIYQVTKKV